MLVAGRAIQGAAAGGIMLLVNIVISDMFDMRRRALYLGVCDMVWAVSGAIGPVLGGVFAEYTSWRWIWLVPACPRSWAANAKMRWLGIRIFPSLASHSWYS